MVEVGYVKAVNGEYASLVFKRKSGCGDNCAHCGSNCSMETSIVDVENTLNASVGDLVQVSLEANSFLKMNLWVYMFPLISMIIGIVVGNSYFSKLNFKNYDILTAFTGIIFLVLSFFILSTIDKKMSKDSRYKLHMTKIIEKCNVK